MKSILKNINLEINDKVYLKNPNSSKLGKSILRGSVDLMDEIGFENFTFKKLAQNIESTEASVYRYFENKHYLLLYLILWYWSWMEYRLVFKLTNIEDPNKRIGIAINLLTEKVLEDHDFYQVNEVKLSKIVIADSSKVYLCKDVDKDNAEGLFSVYKSLVDRVAQIILEVNPSYKYPHMLVSTIIEGAHDQRFFAEHLPRLTNTVRGEDSVTSFYLDLIKKAIKNG